MTVFIPKTDLSTQKKELLVRVGDLIEQSQRTDFVISEDTGYFSIDDELVKRIRALIRQTAELMTEVMECYDAEAAADPAADISAGDDEGFLREIGARIASQMAVEEVSGLAFVSRGQLLDMADTIGAALESRHVWKVASALDSGLRRAGRALVAIESAMRECEGLPVEYRQWQNLDDSLEVRRIYSAFRRAILALGGDDPDRAPEGGELAARLASAAEHIARLRDHEIYPYLRIDDRLEIRRLQKRILRGLEQDGTGGEAGAPVWSDLVAFARLLGQVNHRQELREHDRLAVNGLYRRFFEGGETPEALEAEVLALVEPLLGRDDELDEIILHPGRYDASELRPLLERLRKELGKPFGADLAHPAHG